MRDSEPLLTFLEPDFDTNILSCQHICKRSMACCHVLKADLQRFHCLQDDQKMAHSSSSSDWRDIPHAIALQTMSMPVSSARRPC